MRLPFLRQTHRAFWGCAGFLAAAWLAVLVVQPVHVPIAEFSREYSAQYTRALSGVKGQTLVSPSDNLSRIGVWVRTRVDPGEYVRVKFELRRGMHPETSHALGIAVFDRSGSEWQARLVFDPGLVSEGDELYLRLESILSTPKQELHYAYFDADLYPRGALHELDRVEVQGQDLRFKLYRDPRLPKPLAWAEAVVAPALAASAIADGPPGWVIIALVVAVAALGVACLAACGLVAVRLLAVSHPRESAGSLLLILTGASATIMAGAEAPIAKLWVPLV